MSTEMLALMMGSGQKFAKPLEDACINWGISSGRDKVRFLAQLSVESMGFTRVEENLNYRPARLREVFKDRNGLTLAKAQTLCALGPRHVANFVYGGQWGKQNLGNVEPDDGWTFRGRSLIQITGRSNYSACSIACWGDYRLLDDPDLLTVPEHAAYASAWFWHSRHLNGVEDVTVVTKKINGGRSELEKRIALTEEGYDLLDFLVNSK